jgi:predicted membrane protein
LVSLAPLADPVGAFTESKLLLKLQPVRIALGEIFEMDPDVRDRWGRNRGHGGLIGGFILAGIGLILLLQNLGIAVFDDVERFWPLILIVVGVAQAARSVGMGGKVWGAVVMIAGVLFLLNNFDIIHGNLWRFVWPAILIMMGLGMLARSVDRYNAKDFKPGATGAFGRDLADQIRNRVHSEMGGRGFGSGGSRDRLSEWAVFSGVRRRIDSQDFQGGEAFAMFGGVEIDMRKAASKRDEILIEVNALFGGVEIRLPETWDVTVRGSGIFGGYEDKTMDARIASDTKQPHVVVNGFAIFGGVTIQN